MGGHISGTQNLKLVESNKIDNNADSPPSPVGGADPPHILGKKVTQQVPQLELDDREHVEGNAMDIDEDDKSEGSTSIPEIPEEVGETFKRTRKREIDDLLEEAARFVERPTYDPIGIPAGKNHYVKMRNGERWGATYSAKHIERNALINVVEVINHKDERWNCKEALAAQQAEIAKLRAKFKVADFHVPIETDEIIKRKDNSESVGVRLILGVKGSGLDVSEQKSKARGCATGNFMSDGRGAQVWEDTSEMSGKPADMLSAGLAMIQSMGEPGSDIDQADAVGACCQADLKGPPKYLVIPKNPRHLFPSCENMRQPVFRLRKALYGLVGSGFDWLEHCSDQLEAQGWLRAWHGGQAKMGSYKKYLLFVITKKQCNLQETCSDFS